MSFANEIDNSMASSLLQYSIFTLFANGIGNPFIVAKVLSQTQHVPKEVYQSGRYIDHDQLEYEDNEKDSALPNGYVKETYRPLPVFYTTFDAMKSMWKEQGSLALLRGNVVETGVQLAHSVIEPMVEDSIDELFGLDAATPIYYVDSLAPNLLANVASHIVSAVVLNPFEVLKTRLILQRSSKGVRKYQGIFSSLVTISDEEGVQALFSGVVPSIGLQITRRFTRIMLLIFAERFFGVEEESIASQIIEFTLNNLELLITLPLETVMRRLQAQTKKRITSDKITFQPLVNVSKIPYTGTIDCFKRIIKEEGFFALYRGWGMHLNTNFLMSLFSLLSSIQVSKIEEIEEDFGGD